MKSGLSFSKAWSDTDLVEFEIRATDGLSVFCNKVYVDHAALDETVAGLDAFKRQMRGGVYDMAFGSFGPEYASGAFLARLHFHAPGRLAITVKAESEWRPFKAEKVASNATLYLSSEPALLDNFIEELRSVAKGDATEASLWSA